jgi:23S rRNA (uridine2552-2'-O)-methyltransferase
MARRGQEDAYYHRAKREGYVARSVYKLMEMDRRWRLLRRGQRVLDLGCHPGSWLQWISRRVGPRGLVVGVDLKPPVVALPGNARFLAGDLLSLEADRLRRLAPSYHLVLSDAAPPTTGVVLRDVAASLELADRVLELALALLAPGGGLVVKVYYGEGAEELVRRVKAAFRQGRTFRPRATRGGSRETYLVGLGLKPAPQARE